MNVFIFEGPPISLPHLGKRAMAGWRHYQIRLASGSVRNFLGTPDRAKGMVFALRAEFFPAGTWEAPAGSLTPSGCFPLPRQEILERLSGQGVAS